MQLSAGAPPGEELVERFKPTTGLYVGYLGLALALLAIGYVLLDVHTTDGLRIGLGAAFAAVTIWVTQLRPRVTAYSRTLLMKGSLRDTFVPYAAIEQVVLGQTLNIWAHGRRHVCVGIGRPVGLEVRQRTRATGSGSLFGANRAHDLARGVSTVGEPRQQMRYEAFVLSRLDDLVAVARRRHREAGGEAPPVWHRYAVPEIVALAVTGLAFVASLLA
jgi:hypothetical protein